jgi:hypothetical protein
VDAETGRLLKRETYLNLVYRPNRPEIDAEFPNTFRNPGYRAEDMEA